MDINKKLLGLFKDERGKPKLVGPIIIMILFILLYVVLKYIIPSSTDNNSSEKVLHMQSDFPPLIENVDLEKDEVVGYIQYQEMQGYIARSLRETETDIFNTIRDEIDMRERDLVSKINTDVSDKMKPIYTEIKNLKNNENKYVDNKISAFDKEINFLRDENKYLKQKLEYLTSKLESLENNNTSSRSSSSLNIPSNNYRNRNEPEVKEVVKIVEKPVEVKEEIIPFTLSGIIEGENLVAIFNKDGKNYSYEVGEYFFGYIVFKINKNNVILKKDDKEYVLPLGGGE